MRRSLSRPRLVSAAIALTVALALVLSIAPGPNRATAQDGATVDIANFAFSPNSVTITAGSTVTWTNSDSVPHTATGDGFDTGNIASGASASITFDTPGTFSYICSIHPNMTGTVVVVAAGDGDDDGDDDVTGLPDTGAGMLTSDGQFGGLAAAGIAALGGLVLAMAGLALRRRAA